MTDPDPGTDPTHALDDFIRRMRQPGHGTGADPAAPPDLTAPAASPATTARPRSGALRSGQRWSADDVEDVPVVDLPVVDLAAEARRAEADAARLSAWQPDPTALQLRTMKSPRLLSYWQPGAWVGALRQVLDSATEFIGSADRPAVESYPPQRLLLLWPPQPGAAPLGRWPQQAALLATAADACGHAALALLPEGAPLWLASEAQADAAGVDWALGAEIVLHHSPALRPFQTEGLRRFIATEREAVFARINLGYARPPGAAAVARGS